MKTRNLVVSGLAGSVRREGWWRAGAAVACGMALAMFSLAVPAAAQKKSKGGGGTSGGNTAVTSTLDGNIDNPAYQIQSDGGGPYTNGANNVESVVETTSSCGSGCGDWILNTKSSNSRSISITLVADPSNSPSLPFNGPDPLPTRIIVNCSQTVNGSFLAILPSKSQPCPMALNFIYNSNTYKLSMGYSAEPTTNPVEVACSTVNSSGVCDVWTVLPSSTLSDGVTPNNVAELDVYQGKGKNASWVLVGYFDVNFSFKVTNP